MSAGNRTDPVVPANVLLRTFPAHRSRGAAVTPIEGVELGAKCTLILTPVRVGEVHRTRTGKNMLKVTFTDDPGTGGPLDRFRRPEIDATFFAQRKPQYLFWLQKRLRGGGQFAVSGRVGRFHDRYDLAGPAVRELPEDPRKRRTVIHEASRGTMRYRDAHGLKGTEIARRIGEQITHGSQRELPDPLPAEVRERHGIMDLGDALEAMHAIDPGPDLGAAEQRFRLEEILVLQVILAQRRAARARDAAPALATPGILTEYLHEHLPFTLSAGQVEADADIAARIACTTPMNVLLQGDVGSGKTIVAILAMALAADSGRQAALIAPTEVLARQHHATITRLLGALGRPRALDGDARGTGIALLTGSLRTAERRQALLDIASGDAGIVVGTHALLTEDAHFADLALTVIDEQQRFGVDQRQILREKAPEGLTPHTLVLSATPIPRTVALTAFGDLDLVTLSERPGRHGIVTSHVVLEGRPGHVARMWERVREEIDAGRQAFVVCPRIVETEPEPASEAQTVLSVQEVARRLFDLPQLQGLRFGVLHSQVPDDEARDIMGLFAAGEVDLLIATTMIEVGIDVPNATAMVVLDAPFFGLAQLHQLRGRVGRGEHPGIVFFHTDRKPDMPEVERLEELAATDDGFRIAELDLQTRQEGDVLGAAQSGAASSLEFVRVVRDQRVLLEMREVAERIIAEDPMLARHPGLAELVVNRRRESDDLDYLDRY